MNKLLALSDVVTKLGNHGNSSTVLEILKKHKVEPDFEYGAGSKRVRRYYSPEKIDALLSKLAPRKKVAEPAVSKAQADYYDDAFQAAVKKLDGHASYICELGQRVERLERTNTQLEAANRLLIFGMNELLKAAGLKTIPELGANGSTHSAPEARQ